ncbi:MAG: hypothetical protein P8J01_01505 [Acidimicrobiales bacterium]|nr:hypothetical protein [Acidimicrobiales bacterium]MDG1845046.1 hypothetical protein [Acidimicrobiales bacterium]
MTLKKTFTIAVISASLFGGALIGIPLLASADNNTSSLTEQVSTSETEIEEGKSERDGGALDKQRRGKAKKGEQGRLLGGLIESLEIDSADLKAGIENGRTLGEIAEDNGIDSETVVETIVNNMTERLNQAVADGKITGEKALEAASGIQEKAQEIVNTPIGEGKSERDGGALDKQRRGKAKKGDL